MALQRILKKHGIKLLFLFLIFGGTAYLLGSNSKYVGYSPDQPIPFSHKIHAGELQVDCQFCHANVEKSAMATIPDTATCMKCHEFVASDSKNIQFLKQSYSQGIPVRWRKVYDLPDHAKFTHKVHIARGFECSQCHGDVASMDKIDLSPNFTMGWCVNCHRDFNMQSTKPGNNETVHLTECGTCHY